MFLPHSIQSAPTPVSMTPFAHWLTEFARHDRVWYAKRLSGNDTLANGSHQAGPYIPKDFLSSRFPSLNRPELLNPDVWFEVFIDSHSVQQTVRAVWYNNSLRGGTRNESRLTNFGGISSPLLDPENTGALVIFAFRHVQGGGRTRLPGLDLRGRARGAAR